MSKERCYQWLATFPARIGSHEALVVKVENLTALLDERDALKEALDASRAACAKNADQLAALHIKYLDLLSDLRSDSHA